MTYKKGTFGYWWTVEKGNEDIKGKVYDGNIDCSKCKLTSLEGALKEILGNFLCSDNNLTSIKGAPEEVKGYFNCSNNKLTTLKGAPEKVGGDFDCTENKLLKDTSDIFKTSIRKKFKSDIMTDEEYRAGRELYLKLKDINKAKKLLILKNKMK